MSAANCKEILISPLDWGLGHTTRCIPLIGYMLQQGHHITFAGNEWQRHYINKTFRGIETINLPGYEVSYSKTGNGFLFSILSQVPGLLKKIASEHTWLIEHTNSHKYDLIISDNRYGLWHPSTPSVIMTHQLQVMTGLGKIADNTFRKLHYKHLEKFKEVWIVDNEGSNNLAGKLSHPAELPQQAKYLGLLSQFAGAANTLPAEPQLLILLSGPEPQRSIFSKLLWEQAQAYKGNVVFIEGSNKVPVPGNIPSHISWYQQVSRETLLPLLQSASLVICRSGYSSLMDLVALQKKAIIVPTPGQTEQEYLGQHLDEQGYFYSVTQKGFNLVKELNGIEKFVFRKPAGFSFNDYIRVIKEFGL